jgi:hypothetical protein
MSERLDRQVFAMLAYLVQHHDRVVPRQELIEQLWPARFVRPDRLCGTFYGFCFLDWLDLFPNSSGNGRTLREDSSSVLPQATTLAPPTVRPSDPPGSGATASPGRRGAGLAGLPPVAHD